MSAPIEGAHVDVNGWQETVSGADGRFVLNVPRGDDSRPLVVHAGGYAQRLIQTNIQADATSYEIELTGTAASLCRPPSSSATLVASSNGVDPFARP